MSVTFFDLHRFENPDQPCPSRVITAIPKIERDFVLQNFSCPALEERFASFSNLPYNEALAAKRRFAAGAKWGDRDCGSE